MTKSFKRLSAVLAALMGLTAFRCVAAELVLPPVPVDSQHVDISLDYLGELGWNFAVLADDIVDSAGDPISLAPQYALLYLNENTRTATDSLPSSYYSWLGCAAGQTIRVAEAAPRPDEINLGLAAERMGSSEIQSLSSWDPDGANGPLGSFRWIQVTLHDVQGFDGDDNPHNNPPPPGHFALWDSSFGGSVWMSTAAVGITDADRTFVGAGGHSHANWGFTERGIYEVELSATAYLGPNQTNSTSSARQRFFFAVDHVLTTAAAGDWSEPTSWDDGRLTPAVQFEARVHHPIQLNSNASAFSLLIEQDGLLTVPEHKLLTVLDRVDLAKGVLDIRGTVRAGAVQATGGTLALAPGGTLIAERGLDLGSESEYLCHMNHAGTGLLAVTGNARLVGTLALQADSMMGAPGTWGEHQRTILTRDGGVACVANFAVTPASGTYLGHGVVHEGLTCETDAVKVAVFQAAPGDTWNVANNAPGIDRTVDVADIQQILKAGKFNSNEPAVWVEGDFNDDGVVSALDIQLLLGANLFKKGPYAAGVVAREYGTMPDVILQLTPDGLAIDTQGAIVSGFILASSSGLLTGEPAENLGIFQTDDDYEISGQVLFALDGVHLLGKVFPASIAVDQWAKDLSMSYTIEGAPGVYEARLVVPEPLPVNMMLGAMGFALFLFRRRRMLAPITCRIEFPANQAQTDISCASLPTHHPKNRQ